ncbi:hypothetical protein [uncultured Kordia sp.]|uniref:hypothetical protein n=1 Tax=uncultured Kordia sp. TaxID=507699 RepID=UPI00261CD2ED|nr:hypothetical protein [uncultured Kordia sp.]
MELFYIIISGFAVIALFDAIGSILSRQLNFNYAFLTLGSIVIYAFIAIYAAKSGGTITGIIISFLMGIFDSTVGLKISEKLKANIQNTGVNFAIDVKTVLGVSIFAAIIGAIAISIFL